MSECRGMDCTVLTSVLVCVTSLQGALQNPNLADDAGAGFTQAVQAINNFVQSAQPDQARKLKAAQSN